MKSFLEIIERLFLKNHDVSENILNGTIARSVHETYTYQNLPISKLPVFAYNPKNVFPFPPGKKNNLLLYPAVI